MITKIRQENEKMFICLKKKDPCMEKDQRETYQIQNFINNMNGKRQLTFFFFVLNSPNFFH